MFSFDYHIHTNNSFDSKAEMMHTCETAVLRYLKEICFTEHFSLNPKAPTFGYMNWKKYQKNIDTNRKKYSQFLIIKKGLEICEPHLFSNEYKNELADKNLDFILGSVHNVNNVKLRTLLKRSGKKKGYCAYFQEMLKMIQHADIDILSHFDLVKRYSNEPFSNADFTSYYQIIREILKISIERKIGIEINTSTFEKLHETMPSTNILCLYKELGGTLLTIGSDSHTSDKIGNHVDLAKTLAIKCGFNSFTVYAHRVPCQITFDNLTA